MEGYYHCEECSTLFLSEASQKESHTCTRCGRHPLSSQNTRSLMARRKERQPEALPVVAKKAHGSKRVRGPVDQADFVSIAKARRKRQFQVATLTMGGAMVAAIAVAYGLKHYHSTIKEPLTSGQTLLVEQQQSEKAFNEALPICKHRFASFLSTPDDFAKLQFVSDSTRIATILPRYYHDHQFFRPSNLYMQRAGFSAGTNERVIDSLWTDGEAVVEARFIKNAEQDWLLDWESYVRYSETSWVAFLANRPTQEMEFRLYVRERAIQRENDPSTLSVQFYEPRQDLTRGEGVESPEALLSVDSVQGQDLLEAFGKTKSYLDEEGNALSTSVVRTRDPLGMARVRVKLAFEQNEEEKHILVVREVLAADWLGTDLP